METTMTGGATQPLTGVRVIDFSQVMLGPCATQMLADYGADVIKIERPAGDLSRTSLADDPDGPNNPVFRSLNRNKRSVVLDLSKPEGKQVIYDLVRDADVVVNNFRAGVMERLGFGYETLAAINPRIITAFGSGFGRAGPLAHKGGQDILAQALSGLIARKPNADDPYAIYSTALCDYAAGMHLVQAILLALLQREKTGRGQEVAVSLFESALAMQMQEAAMLTQRGQHFSWGAFPLTGVFATKDGAIVLVGAFKAHPLRDISTALGVEDLSLDQRFATFAGQRAHKKELHAIFRERFAGGTNEYWLQRLEEQDLLCAPVLTLAEALGHEQSRVNGSLISLNGGAAQGSMQVMGTPLTMAPSAFALRHPPPALGAHGEEVLGELGYSAERIARLRESGVLK
jgi:crotonobetainyl-CoA:carnitine CoA-transferase CaiB-like acyl-CoA transferase